MKLILTQWATYGFLMIHKINKYEIRSILGGWHSSIVNNMTMENNYTYSGS